MFNFKFNIRYIEFKNKKNKLGTTVQV